MVIDPIILKKLRRQVWREYIHKVNILVENFYKSLLGYQVGYLRFMRKVDIEQGRVKGYNRTETYHVNYEGFMF